jgi:hypothetical protein
MIARPPPHKIREKKKENPFSAPGLKITAGKKKKKKFRNHARARGQKEIETFLRWPPVQVAAMKREQNGGDSVLDWGGNLSSIYVLHKP